MIEVLFVAAAVGLGNFAAAIGIGMAGIDRRAKMRVAIVFGVFESGMPIVGLVLGSKVSGPLGSHASIVGGGLLVALGVLALVQARMGRDDPTRSAISTGRLVAIAAALSIDNLVVGFALGASNVPILLAILVIGAVSIAMSVAGLELGQRLGTRVERYAGEAGAIALVAVGVAVIMGLP